jgi:hypothetical protein
MSLRQQSEITTSSMGKGKKVKRGVFTVDADELVFAFPAAIEEFSDNLGQLLTVLGFRDEAVSGATDTLAAAQGASSEALEDEDEDMVYEDGHFIPLVGGLLLLHLQFLTRIRWSGADNGSGCAVA